MSPKIVFFGNERLATGVSTAAPVLNGLIAAGYDIRALVLAQNDAGHSRRDRTPEVLATAAAHDISVRTPRSWREDSEVDELRALGADIGVLVAYGKIVPQRVIDVFPQGIVNIHPSALPLHRGPTPLESVLASGESETAVSLMQLSKQMDAGGVYAQQPVSLTGSETKQQLADQLGSIGRDMLLQALPGIVSGELGPTDQDDNAATYDALLTKRDAVIDWQRPAAFIERQIRAQAGWPKSRTNIGGREVVITKAHVLAGSGTAGVIYLAGKQLGMHTSDGILIIDELVPSGKKPMAGSDFLLGYKPM